MQRGIAAENCGYAFFYVRLAAHVSNWCKLCVLQAVISLPVKVWSR